MAKNDHGYWEGYLEGFDRAYQISQKVIKEKVPEYTKTHALFWCREICDDLVDALLRYLNKEVASFGINNLLKEADKS